ncbi:MAG: hypothetical protein WBA67_12800 [Jannaschia sp.]
MAERKPTPPIPGDIFQILTTEGVCYGQMTHRTERNGEVIAVYRRFWIKAPDAWSDVLSEPPQFVTTFLLAEAVRRRLFAVVGHAEVPEAQRVFPTFRGSNNPKAAQPIWFFWDGTGETRVDRPLTPDELSFPEGPTLPSAPLLLDMIARNYRVETAYPR